MMAEKPYQFHKIPMALPIFISMMCGAIFLLTPLIFKIGLLAREAFGLSDSMTQAMIYLSPITAIASGVLCWVYWRDNKIKAFIVSSLLLPIYWITSFYLTTQIHM